MPKMDSLAPRPELIMADPVAFAERQDRIRKHSATVSEELERMEIHAKGRVCGQCRRQLRAGWPHDLCSGCRK